MEVGPIPFGDAPPGLMQGPRYTTRQTQDRQNAHGAVLSETPSDRGCGPVSSVTGTSLLERVTPAWGGASGIIGLACTT
jgi:hypothetical protein